MVEVCTLTSLWWGPVSDHALTHIVLFELQQEIGKYNTILSGKAVLSVNFVDIISF